MPFMVAQLTQPTMAQVLQVPVVDQLHEDALRVARVCLQRDGHLTTKHLESQLSLNRDQIYALMPCLKRALNLVQSGRVSGRLKRWIQTIPKREKPHA